MSETVKISTNKSFYENYINVCKSYSEEHVDSVSRACPEENEREKQACLPLKIQELLVRRN